MSAQRHYKWLSRLSGTGKDKGWATSGDDNYGRKLHTETGANAYVSKFEWSLKRTSWGAKQGTRTWTKLPGKMTR